MAVRAGVRAGICITAEPSPIRSVCAASQASSVGTVRAVRLRGPHHVEAELLGVLGQPQLPGDVVGADQIGQVQPETHGANGSPGSAR